MKVTGHTKIREQLRQIAAQLTLPQSFLFAGPSRVGKFQVALEFAQCLSGTQAVAYERGGDILILGRSGPEAAEETVSSSGVLSVASIREAEAFLSRFPVFGRHRVVIIDAAERLNVAASNALLKLLEEPNSTSVVILVTHLPRQLLPTVLSRLFTLTFEPLTEVELRIAFPQVEAPDFFFSLGLPGLIAEAGADVESFEKNKTLLRGLFRLSQLTWAERFALAEQLSSDPERLPGVLETWIIGLRRQRAGQALQTLPFAHFLEAALETLDRVTAREGNPRLLLEKLFTRIPV